MPVPGATRSGKCQRTGTRSLLAVKVMSAHGADVWPIGSCPKRGLGGLCKVLYFPNMIKIRILTIIDVLIVISESYSNGN